MHHTCFLDGAHKSPDVRLLHDQSLGGNPIEAHSPGISLSDKTVEQSDEFGHLMNNLVGFFWFLVFLVISA